VKFAVNSNADGTVGARAEAEQLVFEIQRLSCAAVDVIIHAQNVTKYNTFMTQLCLYMRWNARPRLLSMMYLYLVSNCAIVRLV
jgi:hypothetical protein